MITNTDITVFSRVYDSKTRTDKWTRVYVPEVWWFKSEQSSITAEGRKNQDVITIRIPDTSASVNGFEKVRVTSANYNTFGGNPHVKVVGV